MKNVYQFKSLINSTIKNLIPQTISSIQLGEIVIINKEQYTLSEII